MRHIVTLMLLVVAVIHLLPLAGVLGVEQLGKLYGIDVSDPSLALLMRHRAILFGMLGVLLAVAAFVPALQPLAFIGGFISVFSFLLLAWLVGDTNAQVARVVRADVVAGVCLVIGVAAHAWMKRSI